MYVLNSFPFILTANFQTIRAVVETDNDEVCVFKNYMHVSKVFHDIYSHFQRFVGSWIYNYPLYNQCLSSLKLWVWIPLMGRCTRYNIIC